MKLWRIEQHINDDYDTYDSAVVAAESEAEAIKISPSGGEWRDGMWMERVNRGPSEGAWKEERRSRWCSPVYVSAELIGDAVSGTERGVICASFNAG